MYICVYIYTYIYTYTYIYIGSAGNCASLDEAYCDPDAHWQRMLASGLPCYDSSSSRSLLHLIVLVVVGLFCT
jgi:hypothetical protein